MGSPCYLKAGLIKRNEEGKYVVYEETTDIPMIYSSENPNYYFGCIVECLSNEEFECLAKYIMPSTNTATLEGTRTDFPREDYRASSEENLELATKPDTCSGKVYAFIRFSEDAKNGKNDRPGIYAIEMYFNSELYRRVEFNVFLPDSGKVKIKN
jgi:hypothetical protein